VTLQTVRTICLGFENVTEDIKWGADIVFSVGGKMFCVMSSDPPHQMAFKCTPETFGELIERPGLRPAPYLARAMWVQEEALGESLDRAELEPLLRSSYELVRAKLPKRARPVGKKPRAASGGRRRRSAPSRARRRPR